MATEANIPEDESASKIILEGGFSMIENNNSMESSTSNKSPTEYKCISEHCQADKMENLTFTKSFEDERQHQTGLISNDVEARGDKVEAINETMHIEESTHHTEKDGAKVSMQACAEELMIDQYKSPEVIAENTQKGMMASQENENIRSKGEEDADLECIKQSTSTSETNMGLTSEPPLPNLDLTTKSQGEEDESIEESCAKDETRDPAIHFEDEVKELSLDGVQKKKEDMPSSVGGECKDPESIRSSDKLENDNNTEDASTINVEESGFDAALKIGDNVDDKLENPYSNQVQDGVSAQVATVARETLQEVASTICRDKIKDISEDSTINLEKNHEEKRDSQPKHGQEDRHREQPTLIPEESEVVASRENAERRVEQNILVKEEFDKRGDKDEPTSTAHSEETFISTEKMPPLAESIIKIKGEENMSPHKIANDLNSTDPLVGETGQPNTTDISNDSIISLEKQHEEKRDSQPKNGQEDQQGEQITPILDETEIEASRENAEKRIEQSTLPMEEFEEREKDEPTSTKNTGETSTSTEKIPLLAESITKIKGEENLIPQQIANDLNSTYPLVRETGQPDSTDISEDNIIYWEKHHEEKRDSQPKNGQEEQQGEQATLIPEETEIKASRENAEKRVELNTHHVEEFEEKGEIDEPTSTLDSGETSISTENIPPLAESIIKIKGQPDSTEISEDSIINWEKHHEKKRDTQPKNGQEDQLGGQAILILEETEIDASRENVEKRVEYNTLPVEEYEEIGEIDEPISTPDSGETSISTEKIPPLAESITKSNGEENMIPQQIANSIDPLVGEKGQPNNTNISEDSIINFEKHHEEKRDSQPKNGQKDQLGEQAILIPEETEIEASRENAEKKVEQNTLPVEEFEERGEIDEPTSTPDSGETSISTEKIPSLTESITKIKGEENKTPQEIANDLNSTDPLVGETGQPDSSKVSKTEAQEEHQESSKFCPENNVHDENVSETQSTKHLVVKHMDSEAMVTTETITKLTTDNKEPQKVPDSHSEDEMGIKGEEKILSEETTEGEGAINKQLFATESVTEDEDPSRVPTVVSSRDETIEQSSHEESLKDGEITLIEENESLRPKDEAEESKQASEVFDLPYTRGGQDIYAQQIIEGSGEETLNNFQENEKQIQNMRDDPHEEIKGENHVFDCHLEFIQNIGLEEGYPTSIHLYRNPNECSSAESKSFADSSFIDKSPTKNICDSDHQILTESENERQHQNKVEESNPKVHEEETSIENKHFDQHLELITDQYATFEVIPASTEKEMITSQTNENTTPKRDEDADLECNQQGINIFEKSCKGIEAALHDEDEFKEINLTRLQNEKAGQMREVDWKDPESSRSSDKTEHENNDEFKLMTSSTEDASTVIVAPSPYIHSVEESTYEAPSNNEDNDNKKLDNPSSSLLTDMENTQVAIEAGETVQDASNATCQDNDHDICESVRQEIDVTPVDNSPKADDLACLKRDIRGENEENIQTGFPDNSEESKINPETHDGEKRDLDHKNEQEHKVREQAHQILENVEIEAVRENDEKKMEHNIYPAEDFDIKETTSAPNTGETSISTEKSLSLVESISEINNEERISPQQIADNLNTNGPVVEETGQPYSGDIVSKTDAPEEHQELSEFCVECNKQHEHHPETQSTENLIIKQVDPIVTTETVSESIKDIEEIKKFPLSYYEEKKDIEKNEKIIPKKSKEMEEAIDKQSHETAKESISEDQAPSRLLTTTLIRDEAIEQSTIEESLKDSESTLIEKNENHRAENDAEEKIKATQAPEPSEATGSKDVYNQQIMEGSVEETVDKFQYNEKENEDASTEIRGETYDTSLPYEVNQNNGLEEGHSMADQLEGNPNKCSQSEFESSVELSSIEESQTEKNLESEQFQANKAEAINDKGIKEPDHDIEHDSAKSSTLASAQKSNLKVHGEEISIDNSNLDQHLKVLTDQHASFEVIPECVEKEMITSQTKREEDADLEHSDIITSTYEITLDKTSEASLPNLELAITSRSEEDKTVIESLTKDEGIETTKHVEDESKDLSLIRIQNREAETAFVREGRQRDLQSTGSSNKLEYENNREEDASTTNIVQLPCVHNVEESIDEAASKNADNDENNWENPSSNPVTDGASLQVAIEAVETLQEASHTACKDKNKDKCESVWPEEDVPPVDKMARLEDSAYLDNDAKGTNKEDINQAGLTETIDDSRINPETHDVEKKESLQKNDQEYELGEQAVPIPEKMEEEAPIGKAEKRIEQDPNSVEKFEEQEKDELTSSPDSGETLISRDKSLPLAESTNKINSKERIFPQNIASDLNTKDPLVEDLGKFDIDETSKKTQEKFEYSSNTYTENDKQVEQHSEASSRVNLDKKHMYSEEMVATNTIIKSTKETEEIDRVPKSLSQEKTDIKGDEKITPEEPKEMEKTTGVSENEALSRLPITASVGEEKNEQNFQEGSPKDDAAMIDKNEGCIPEIDAEKDKKAVEEFGLPKTNGRQDIDEKQVIEEYVEETMKNFQDDQMKTQILREDTGEIEGKSSVSNLSSELIQHGKTDETILYESNETVENHDSLDISSKKDEETLFGQYGNPTTKEASIENQDECVYSMKVDEDKAQLSSQYFESVACTEGEETSVQLENFSQKEKMEEEPKDKDSGKENNASHQEVNEPSETEFFALKPEEGEIERTAGKLSSATVGMDTRKEYMEEVECDRTEIKEQVEITESEGQIEAISSIEGKICNPLDDFSKPKEDHDVLTIQESNSLVKCPSSILGVPKKGSSNTNDSEAEYLRVVNENTAMKEVKPVDADYLEGSDGAHEMMDVTISETKSNCLGGDIAERQEAETNSQNRNMEVKEVVDRGEQISHDIKEKDLITCIKHEKESTTTDDQLEHDITDSSIMPSHGEHKTVEISKTTENTPARENVLFIETETPSITHTEGSLMLASLNNEKGEEYSNEVIKKHNDEDQPIPPDLKAENISLESDTGGIVREKREQRDSLADLNEAFKLEIVEDEKPTIEVTKTLLQEEELTEKTEGSSTVIGVEREAPKLKTATSGSQEEYLNTKSGELLLEKDHFLAKDQSKEILLHSNNIQTKGKHNNLKDQDPQYLQEVPALNLEPGCNDEDLLNLSLDQDGNINAIKITHEVYQRSGIADNNESFREHPTDGTITSPREEIENEVEVSTSKFTEQTESTKSTEGKKPQTLDSQAEQNMEITDLSALKSSDASATNIDDSSSTPKVYEKETEASFIKKDDSATDDPKIVPVLVEIEETGLKNFKAGHIEYDRGSVLVSENEDETAITTDMTTSDSIDIVGREEISNSEKEEILEELNEGNLKTDSWVMETDNTTTVQQEREQSISTFSMSQDYPAPLIEENATMGNAKIHPKEAKSTIEEIIDEAAETCHVSSIENTLPEKEHEVVKPGGPSDLESVYIMKECSNGDSPGPKNEVNEEKVLVEASKCKADSTHEDSEIVQGQGNEDTTLEGSLTNVAIDKAKAALQNEPTDEVPPKKTVEAADTNQKVELASESTAEDQRDENICQAEGKGNCEDNVCKMRNNVPDKRFQRGIQREADMQFEIVHHMSVPRDAEATILGGCTENVPAATEMANGSENILEHSQEPTSNLKESDILSTCYETVNKAAATDSGFLEQRGGMDLVEERESRISENLANANEDFSFTAIEASEEGLHTECEKENKAEASNKDDTHTSESLLCLPERNDVTTIDEVAKTEMPSSEDGSDMKSQKRAEEGCENQHEEISEATGEGEYGSTKDNPPDDEDGKNVTKVATELTHENQGTEPEITGSITVVMNQGEKDQEVEADSSEKEHIDTAEVIESTREIQKLKESSLREGGIKATVTTDAEIRETNEDVEQDLHKPDGETKAEVQLEKAKSTNMIVESTVEEENVPSSTREIQKLEEEVDMKAIVKRDAENEERNEDIKQGLLKPEVQLEAAKSTNITVENTRVEEENVSSSTREIQKLEESSLGEVDIKATVKADAETRETNEDINQGLHKLEEVIKPEIQLEKVKSTNKTMESKRVEEENVSSSTLQETKHLDEEATELAAKAEKAETPQCEEPKAESDEDERVNENETIEPLPSVAAIMVETPKDGEEKAKHKKSHSILSGVGSKVKHSISKVKKAITGKSSHPKTSSPK